MTINLLTSVPEGLVMCADSMLTLNTPSPNGMMTTNFSNAEKLVELGASLPAAAMVSGQGMLAGEVIGVVLKRASAALDAGAFAHDATGIEAAVEQTVTPVYSAALSQFKAELAQQWAQPGWIENLNSSRATRGLPPVTELDPNRIRIQNDPLAPTATNDWDVQAEFELTIVVASFFSLQRAIALAWPGPRIVVCVPGAPLWWWGSGGSSVARLVRGFDLGLAERLAQQSDTDALDVIRVANTRSEYAMPTPISSMPLQDALDFTEFLGQVSCGYDKFTAGPPGVGGPLDVLVLRMNLREWIHQKRIHSSIREH